MAVSGNRQDSSKLGPDELSVKKLVEEISQQTAENRP